MRKETAIHFWRRYLRLMYNHSASTNVGNPACDFYVSSRAGEYDSLPDEEYYELQQDFQELSSFWRKETQRTARDIFLNAFEMTDISAGQMEQLVQLLAGCSAQTKYPVESEASRGTSDQGESPQKSRTPGAEERAAAPGSPQEIYNSLSGRILGQDEAKKTASMIVYNHLEGRRSTSLFCGPSGCGKSEIWRYLSKTFPGLIRIADASRLSADGWKGSFHIRDIFEDIPAADLQQRGLIVVLDEADKLCCEPTVSTNGTDYSALIQNSLLKMLEGDQIEFGSEDRRKAFKVDCSNVSIVLLGSFEKLLQSKSAARSSIGFGSDSQTTCDYSNTDISYDDLIASGMRREIAGRINRIVSLRPLTVSDYRAILTGPVLNDLQSSGKYHIVLDEPSADLLSRQAATSGLGVRWMRSQIINAVDDLMFQDPRRELYTITLAPAH